MFVVSPNRNELTLESVDNMNIINQQWNSIPTGSISCLHMNSYGQQYSIDYLVGLNKYN